MNRYELVKRVMKGDFVRAVALEGEVSARQLWKWVKRYKENGYEGLEYHGDKTSKEAKMSKKQEKGKMRGRNCNSCFRFKIINKFRNN